MHLSPEAIVFLLSSLPLIETRVAVPVGAYLHLSTEAIFIWSVLGNLAPTPFILLLLEPVGNFLMKHSKFFHKLLTKIFNQTRDRHAHKFNKYGPALIIAFVGLHIPGTGTWSGALAAYLFGIKFWKALLYITIGVLINVTIMLIILHYGIIGLTHFSGFLHFFTGK